jgi:hypothetical protein
VFLTTKIIPRAPNRRGPRHEFSVLLIEWKIIVKEVLSYIQSSFQEERKDEIREAWENMVVMIMMMIEKEEE